MSGRLVVKRYARALFEISRETEETGEIRSDMDYIESLVLKNPEIRDYCLARHARRNNERVFVSEAFLPFVSDFTAKTLELLVENGRLDAIPYLPEAFREQEDSVSETIPLEIESAAPLSPELMQDLEKRMQKKLGKTLRTRNIVKPEILGGIRLVWNNTMMDLSLQGRLKKMKRLLR